jgi:hypothetical protein
MGSHRAAVAGDDFATSTSLDGGSAQRKKKKKPR